MTVNVGKTTAFHDLVAIEALRPQGCEQGRHAGHLTAEPFRAEMGRWFGWQGQPRWTKPLAHVPRTLGMPAIFRGESIELEVSLYAVGSNHRCVTCPSPLRGRPDWRLRQLLLLDARCFVHSMRYVAPRIHPAVKIAQSLSRPLS